MSSSNLPKNGATASELVAQLATWLEPKPNVLRFRAYVPNPPSVVKDVDKQSAVWRTGYGGLLKKMGLDKSRARLTARSELAIAAEIRKMLRHSSALEQFTWKKCAEATPEWLNEFAESYRRSQADRGTEKDVGVALTSRCLTNAGPRHIPILKFRCGCSPRAQFAVRCGLREIGLHHGILLQRDHSYQFLGFRLLDEHEFVDFVGKALLLLPLVDGRYLGHRILESEFALRVTKGLPDSAEARVIETF